VVFDLRQAGHIIAADSARCFEMSSMYVRAMNVFVAVGARSFISVRFASQI